MLLALTAIVVAFVLWGIGPSQLFATARVERSFEDMVREINHLIDQLTDDERKTYLAESLFLNTVKYENDKLEAYIRKLEQSR